MEDEVLSGALGMLWHGGYLTAERVFDSCAKTRYFSVTDA